jgi:hypothetical protein
MPSERLRAARADCKNGLPRREWRAIPLLSCDFPPTIGTQLGLSKRILATYRIELAGQNSEVQRLLQGLVAANVGLLSSAEKEPTLEDVFMMVTKGLVT